MPLEHSESNPVPKNDSIHSCVSTAHRLVTDRQTDRHQARAYIALCTCAACKYSSYKKYTVHVNSTAYHHGDGVKNDFAH